MLRFKDSVDIRGIQPELAPAFIIADQVWLEHGSAECVITSATDGIHSRGSLHYVGLAFDLRIWAFKGRDAVREAATDLQQRLGHAWDVVVENESDGSPSHVHVEYQPKRALNEAGAE